MPRDHRVRSFGRRLQLEKAEKDKRMRNWMTVTQVAALTGYSETVIRHWIQDNLLGATKVGNVYRIPLEEAQALNENRHPHLPRRESIKRIDKQEQKQVEEEPTDGKQD